MVQPLAPLLFKGFIIFYTADHERLGYDDHILASMQLYLDILNLSSSSSALSRTVLLCAPRDAR